MINKSVENVSITLTAEYANHICEFYNSYSHSFLRDRILSGKEVKLVEFSGNSNGIEKFIETIINLGFKGAATSMDGNCFNGLFCKEDSIMTLSYEPNKDGRTDTYIKACLTSVELADNISKTIKPLFSSGIKKGEVYILVTGSSGVQLKSLGKSAIELSLDNYSEEIIEDYKHIVEDFKSMSPCGRLVIFSGLPGTGKSYMIRSLIGEKFPEHRFVFIPSYLVADLTGPNLIDVLMESFNSGERIVLIVEDADTCLMRREADNVNQLSSILNLTDGILSECLDFRIICTTNVEIEELDAALTRDGRLCKHVVFNKLPYEKAKNLYDTLGGKDPLEKMDYTLGEIYKLTKTEKKQTIKGNKPRIPRVGFGC